MIALQLCLVLLVFQATSGVWAQGETKKTPTSTAPATSTPTPVSNPAGALTCDEVLREGVNKSENVDIRKSNIPDEDIIVLLTEGIVSGGNSVSCGRIIYCLRVETSKDKATADTKFISEMKSKYSQCIVSGKDGLGLLNNYAGLVYQWIAGIVGAICILMIIISGIQISIGGLSPDEVNEAKERIIRSLTGMVVLFLSAFILYTINPIFFS